MNIGDFYSSIKKDKKTLLIIIIGVVGIIFLVISNYSATANIDSNEDNISAMSTQTFTADEIEQRLEEKLINMISSVKGAGNVQVMVTVASAGEYVYAENKQYDSDTDSSSSDTEIVIFEQNDTETGLVISIKSPDVLGVAVLCEGGGSSVVRSEITDLVTSLFGIGSDRVYVGSKS